MFLYSWYREGTSQLSQEFYDLIQVLGLGLPSGLPIECLSSLLPQSLKKWQKIQHCFQSYQSSSLALCPIQFCYPANVLKGRLAVCWRGRSSWKMGLCFLNIIRLLKVSLCLLDAYKSTPTLPHYPRTQLIYRGESEHVLKDLPFRCVI